MAKINKKGKKEVLLQSEVGSEMETEIMRRGGAMKQLNCRFPSVIFNALMDFVKETHEGYSLVIRHALYDFLKARGKL